MKGQHPGGVGDRVYVGPHPDNVGRKVWGGAYAGPQASEDRSPVKANVHQAWQDFKDWRCYGIVPSTGLDDLFDRVRDVLARAANGDFGDSE